MDNSLFVYKRKSISDLFGPSACFFNNSRVSGCCRNGFWVIEDVTLQVSFALFHDQDNPCGTHFLEKRCAIKLYNVRMVQLSNADNERIQSSYTGDSKSLYFSNFLKSFRLYSFTSCGFRQHCRLSTAFVFFNAKEAKNRRAKRALARSAGEGVGASEASERPHPLERPVLRWRSIFSPFFPSAHRSKSSIIIVILTSHIIKTPRKITAK